MIDVLLRGLSTQARVIGALTVREVRLKNTRFAFSYFFDLFETVAMILIMSAFFILVDRKAGIGDSVFVFVTTGVVPLYFFKSVSTKTAAGVRQSKSAKIIAFVTILDVAVAKFLVEAFKYTMLTLVLFSSYYIARISVYSIPTDMTPVLKAILIMSLLGLGIGITNAFIQLFFPPWGFIWSFVARGQLFLSGIFQIPEYSLPYMREILVWNPLAHAVGLFRMGFYPTYPRFFIDPEFAMLCGLCVLTLGLMMERAFRNRAAVG